MLGEGVGGHRRGGGATVETDANGKPCIRVDVLNNTNKTLYIHSSKDKQHTLPELHNILEAWKNATNKRVCDEDKMLQSFDIEGQYQLLEPTELTNQSDHYEFNISTTNTDTSMRGFLVMNQSDDIYCVLIKNDNIQSNQHDDLKFANSISDDDANAIHQVLDDDNKKLAPLLDTL